MHSEPVQPAAQLQVSGAEHVPPFSQALLQIAVNHKSHDHTLWCTQWANYSHRQFDGDPL